MGAFNPSRLLENYFRDPRIRNANLARFTEKLIEYLKARNEGGKYDALIAKLEDRYATFTQEVAHVMNTTDMQVGETGETDAYLVYVGEQMTQHRDAVSAALGGRTTPAYLAIYPGDRIGVYTELTKRDAPARLQALSDAAVSSSAPLGPLFTALLKSFATEYDKARGEQLEKMAANTDNRADRNSTRRTLETVLMNVVRTIATEYGEEDDTTVAMGYFPWHLLWPNGVRPGTGEIEEEAPLPPTS